jgi:SAM-dependent methyltransferase
MDGYRPSTYGDAFADVYDEWYGDDDEATLASVDRLAAIASETTAATGGPRALELGVGSGRVAIPLSARGVEVWGIDASQAMLDRLHAKAGTAGVRTVAGDMADLDLGRAAESDRPFDLVYVVRNTLFNLCSADAQARCLTAVAAALGPGGRFVVEAFVPADDLVAGRRAQGAVEVRAVELDRVVLQVSLQPGADTVVHGQHVEITEQGVRLRPWVIRYVSPTELDDLAAAVGLRLRDRWAGWRGEPFDDTSPVHVSTYVHG